jgi:DNA-binding NarL/FixJ family response regulator
LSDSRFLREALSHALNKTLDIVVVGTCPHWEGAPMEIIESNCDVLLTESVSVLALESQIPDEQLFSLSHVKIVMIETNDDDPAIPKLQRVLVMRYLLKEAAVADVIATVRRVANWETIYELQR